MDVGGGEQERRVLGVARLDGEQRQRDRQCQGSPGTGSVASCGITANADVVHVV